MIHHFHRPTRYRCWLTLLVCGVTLSAITSSNLKADEPASDERLAGFDTWVTAVMAEWKVPGLGIAVIEDGKILLAQGYGHRNIEDDLPVTADTLFAIGSNSKSFTVTLMGMLNDEGKLDWDRSVQEYLPNFRLHDPVASAQMTPRDLVTHTSGLPRHDLLWYASGRSRDDLFSRLRHLEPTKSFRSTYQYQNLMFMTAGYLAGQVADSTWESLVARRIFKPLGMERSNLSVNDSQQDGNFALPYSWHDDEIIPIPFRNIDAIGPAGSINSSANEMIRYIQFHIDHGKHGETRLLSKRNAFQMQQPQFVTTDHTADSAQNGADIFNYAYGLGLSTTTYRGHKFVGHGGGIDGFISAMSWLPHERIGAVVLTNFSGEPNPVPNIVTRRVFDKLLGLEPIDWNARIREAVEKSRTAQEEAREKAAAERHEGTSPSHPLEAYVGTYRHPGYGDAVVSKNGRSLVIDVVGFSLPLDHFHYDVFAVPDDVPREIDDFARQRVQFFYDKKGEVDRVAVPLEASTGDILFDRVGGDE